MKYLVFQSDDYGITNSVAQGILYGIRNGIIKNTGLFVNMPSSEESAKLIKDIPGISVGIDINYVAGRPVSPLDKVSSLVDENGHFYPSGKYFKENKLVRKEGNVNIYEHDPFDYQQILCETENQVKHFIELMGRKPAYIHSHSISTPNTVKAAGEVAKKYDLVWTKEVRTNPNVYCVPCDWTPRPFPIEAQKVTDVENNFLASLEKSLDHEIGYFICHCGYVDNDLLNETTYTLIRCKDLAMATSDKVKTFLDDHHIELITHDQLKEILK